MGTKEELAETERHNKLLNAALIWLALCFIVACGMFYMQVKYFEELCTGYCEVQGRNVTGFSQSTCSCGPVVNQTACLPLPVNWWNNSANVSR